MKLFDHTFTTPAENLAADEVLLEWCEQANAEEVLRFWEARDYFAVVGYSNKVATEVNEAARRTAGIPIYRRCSGGGTVLQGPGCLNYALIIKAPSESVTETNRFIMERNRAALEKLLGQPVSVEGHTDLAVDGRKFSGNSQRRKRRYVLFHGTFLLNFDLAKIEKLLLMPTKRPCYRQDRSHADFLCNINASAATVRQALTTAWGVTSKLEAPPLTLDITKYSSDEWIWKF